MVNGSVYYYDVLNHQVKPYCSLEGDIQVSSLLKDKTGRLWLGTRGDGLYCLKKGEMKQLCVLPQCNVFNLYQDSSGDIWVCTWEDGLYHISDNGTVHYTDGGADRTHCISSNSVRDCCEDNQGNLWIATFNGLDKFDKKKNEFVYYTSTDIPGSLSNASVYCIIKDHQGTLWVGTYFGGVNYFNPEYEIYTHYSSRIARERGT